MSRNQSVNCTNYITLRYTIHISLLFSCSSNRNTIIRSTVSFDRIYSLVFRKNLYISNSEYDAEQYISLKILCVNNILKPRTQFHVVIVKNNVSLLLNTLLRNSFDSSSCPGSLTLGPFVIQYVARDYTDNIFICDRGCKE